MPRVFPLNLRIDDDAAYQWARRSGEAAAAVPALGREARDWTLRGWAEVMLGCLVLGVDAAVRGLDDVVRESGLACGGRFAQRLRALRQLAGRLPQAYGQDGADEPEPVVTPSARTEAAWRAIGRFCDSLLEVRRIQTDEPPVWSGVADHLGWGSRWRPTPLGYPYEVVQAPAMTRGLTWRCWLALPTGGRSRLVLVAGEPGRAPGYRGRICHGVHNGAHLDHLAAVVTRGPVPAPIEFGSGLLAAEAYAMAVELLAAAECAAAGLAGEAAQLRAGLVERIGRVPGYRQWYDSTAGGHTSPSLIEAASVQVGEFQALPALAANYVVGPLAVLAGQVAPDLLPERLAGDFHWRWTQAERRFPAAAVLAERAGDVFS
ncbi:hypothetical protein [Catenulispora rubra]|uniref:hypothetical protein n=1 Tax=Catenulispora rubra TaxID=280293 RepID=UPI0018927EC2|nr:hypothetical protein [Catenulispora rubra]